MDERGINYYFQFTLNDYEAEGLEPELPNLHNRIDSFQHLAGRIGKERVIWRLDPLTVTDKISPSTLIRKVDHIAQQLAGYTDRLIISFFKNGVHKRVDRKLDKMGIKYKEFSDNELTFVAKALADMGKHYKMIVSACADVDLACYGIQPAKCIDDELIRAEFSHDKVLMEYLAMPENLKSSDHKTACHCIGSEDIGRYDTFKQDGLDSYASGVGGV